MLLSICGTPGVGKTTVCRLLRDRGWDVFDLKGRIEDEDLYDHREEETGEMVVDPVSLKEYLEECLEDTENDVVIDGHLSYLAPSDLCIVLRLNPDVIGERLGTRDYPERKVRENMEAEAVGSVLVEAMELEEERLGGRRWEDLVEGTGPVCEIDVTGSGPEEVLKAVLNLISARKGKILNELSRYRPGRVDWMEVVAGWY
ncbi:MAG: adenylate kinase family protein [Thermoplasmatota archaeon]